MQQIKKTILTSYCTWASQLSVNLVYDCHSQCCQTHVNQPCATYPMCQGGSRTLERKSQVSETRNQYSQKD